MVLGQRVGDAEVVGRVRQSPGQQGPGPGLCAKPWLVQHIIAISGIPRPSPPTPSSPGELHKGKGAGQAFPPGTFHSSCSDQWGSQPRTEAPGNLCQWILGHCRTTLGRKCMWMGGWGQVAGRKAIQALGMLLFSSSELPHRGPGLQRWDSAPSLGTSSRKTSRIGFIQA